MIASSSHTLATSSTTGQAGHRRLRGNRFVRSLAVFGASAALVLTGGLTAAPAMAAPYSAAVIPSGSSLGIAISPDDKTAYIVEKHIVKVVDLQTNAVRSAIEVADAGYVAVSHDGSKIFVTNGLKNGRVSVFDSASENLITTLDVGDYPSSVVVSPDGKKVYVSSFDGITVIDASTEKVITTIAAGDYPTAVAITPDGKKAFVSDLLGGESGNGEVLTINLDAKSVESRVKIESATALAISPDGAEVWVAGLSKSTGVTIISVATGSIIGTVSLPTNFSMGVTFAPDGKSVWVADGWGVGVVVVDTATRTISSSISTAVGGSTKIAFNKDGTKAYTTSYFRGSVTVIYLLETMTTMKDFTVAAGESVKFAAKGFGAGGAAFGVVEPVYTSTEPSDSLAENTFTFTKAGKRTITASLAGVTTKTTVMVEAGPVSTLAIRTDSTKIIAGEPVDFRVYGADAFGNTHGEVEYDGWLQADDLGAVRTKDGFVFTAAGKKAVSANSGDLAGDLSFVVHGAAPVEIAIDNTELSVDQGGSITLVISGVDEFGNELSALDAVLSSDQPGDVITGNTVTFPHASPHVITATIGTLSKNVTVQVVPAATTVPAATGKQLAFTGVDTGAGMLGGLGALTALMLGLGAVIVTRNRRREAQLATDRLFQ